MLLFAIFSILGLQVYAQNTVTGTVNDDAGEALPGVSVLVKGTTVGTMTLADGTYSIDVPDGSNTLVFSYIGMETQEVVISGDVVDVTLSPADTDVGEVVVTALGISKEKRALGYATQELGGDELNEAPEQNLVNSLSGKLSGVQITNSSGAVGSSSRIVLRGASSIYGSSEPLFVVDGIPISNASGATAEGNGGFDAPNGVADINPNDIESINVLKGANASALYGIRASNGVIVITTKKGKKGNALGLEFNTSLTFENPLVLPDYQNSYGQGPSHDYFEYINGSDSYSGVDESWGPPLDVGLEFMQFTSYINNPDNPQPEPWVSKPNNVRDFFDTGITSKTDLAFSGGTEKGSYRLGLGYSNQKGMVPFTDFKKYSASLTSTYQLSKRIHSSANFHYINSRSDNLPSSGYDGANVVQQTIWGGRQVDWEALRDYENLPTALPGSTFGEGITPINWNTNYQNNPFWQLATNQNKFNRDRILGNIRLSLDITDWMKFSAGVAMDQYFTFTSVNMAKGSAGDAPTYWRFGGVGNRDGSEGYYDETKRTFREINSDFLLTINPEIGSDFNLNVALGGNRMHRNTSNNFQGIQIELPEVYNLLNVKSGSDPFVQNGHEEQEINSFYGNAELSYRDYLYLNLTGRNDWASVLPVDNNSYFYPSATLSAILSDMLSISSSTIDMIKLRASWAQVGGAGALGPNDIIPVYTVSSSPWEGAAFANFPNTLRTPNIKPEKTTSIEAGLQLALFGNRVRFDATYYDQTTIDLILPVQVSYASGVLFVWNNVGEIRNRGVELQLGTTVLKTSDLTVDLDFNFAKNKNEVIKAGDNEENDEETIILGSTWNMNLEAREGYPYGVIVGQALLRNDAGDVIYQNGLPQQGDTEVLGDINPDWTGGVQLSVNYKGLHFTTLVDAKLGGEIYTMTNAWGQYAGILAESLEGRETGLVGDGVMNIGTADDPEWVENNVVVTAEDYNKATYGNSIVETSVFDASYVKLRQVTLGYNLPAKWFSSVGIQGLRVSFVGRNLAILYKKVPHIDPESGYTNNIAAQGQEFGQLPSTRSLGFSLNVKF